MKKQSKYVSLKLIITDTSQAPRGKDIFYKCLKCDGMISSVPKDSVGCKCYNVFIDKDYQRLAVDNFDKFEVIKKLNE